MKGTKTMSCMLALLCALMLTACAGKQEVSGEGRLDGSWLLTKIERWEGQEFLFPENDYTLLRIFDRDSAFYVCDYIASPNGYTISARTCGTYTLIDKGGGEWLYLEDGEKRPLTIVNDTTIVIQITGNRYTFVREHDMPRKRIAEIAAMLDGETADSETVNRYVFSKAEEELKSDKLVLAYSVMGILVVLLLVCLYAYDVRRNKRRAERQLQQLTAELANRPQQVTEALRSVEDEFHHSDYYLSLRRRISTGRPLSKDEWDEAEAQLSHVYPGLQGKLFNLHRMSETEYRVCLLIKLGIPPSEMAGVLCKDISTVSSIRSRLFQKVFDKKGGAKDWDDFILSL